MMPAVFASAARSVPSYQQPAVGRATEGMIANTASERIAALISLTREVTTPQRQERKALSAPPARVSASQKASAMSSGMSNGEASQDSRSVFTASRSAPASIPAAFAPLRQNGQ